MNRLFCACLIVCVLGINTYAETRLSGVGAREGHRKKKSESTERMSGCCGLPGRDGRDGRDGIQGPYGAPGAQGEMGPSGDSTVNNLDKIVDDLTAKFSAVLNKYTGDKPNQKSEQPGVTFTEESTVGKSDRAYLGGAVYTRWGRKVCPNHSDMLYAGVMAGSHYTQTGNGANHLCLPLNPQWNNSHAGHQSFTYLHGTEIELYPKNPVFHKSNSGGSSQHNRDAQCAVCYTPGRPSHVMIPARLECPIGWTVEYLGFMMAAHNTHAKTEYVCVDQDPDTRPGTAADDNGHLLYIVEVACGPLPCPEYVNGYEVTCVVCTK